MLADVIGNRLYWIGLTDQLREGEFYWSESGELAEYTNWRMGEPNHGKNAAVDEDCVHLEFASNHRTWNDRPCSHSHLFALCKKGNL